MAYDLKTNILRAGLTKTEVEKLLGEPDANRANFHEYLLGMCSGLRIDFDTLDVHFDSDGKLVKVQVVQY
jgi:outer membrane protein assembly factor BamE (lipoprotein component of BamABCDE complex)